MKKNENGITLTALVVYVTVMSIAIAAIATITTYAYKNMNNLEEDSQYAVELNKFDMYFLKDLKKAEIIVIEDSQDNAADNYHKITMLYYDEDDIECSVTYEYIKKDSENKDVYSIVRGFTKDNINNNIIICTKVTKCIFTREDNRIRVQLTINNKDQKDMDYIAENLQIGN